MSRLFFFSSRRRHTRLQGDWSSDVCSSDLSAHVFLAHDVVLGRRGAVKVLHPALAGDLPFLRRFREIGRASCRGRVEISVVAVSLKKKKREWTRIAIG